MKYRVLLTKRFATSLQEMGDYIAADNAQRAISWLAEVEAKVMKLDYFPESHPYARENEDHAIELRQLVFGRGRYKYRVIFTVKESDVIALDIRHAAREGHPPQSL
ncbi:type II toxin-antitoxin system RelE/ParE family toxin [Persicirhabdus sediminis]|uniref:Type II toxin-antitoxin system RelE/ParE family toxin n=1 Tax=Persicirhabdus sediminis TaxID=454144 RepID=A0A8J7MFV1_9BACT|nr:type II toxin-antitoxin system RelE/ParE family toxin [Persicirhabdus sediminis]MBK1792022.1 type II toxin-antitoxin system RelE/ParE family toxin [Persicirhabdus sediminis]